MLVLTALSRPQPASAQSPPDKPDSNAPQSATEALAAARMALQAGEHQRAADLLSAMLAADSSLTGDRSAATLDSADRAEAWRIYGLSLYFLKSYEPARLALFEYLKLDYDARLDPSLWPPEVIAFFEDVRSRNAAELLDYKPKPKKRRSVALNLVPPLGQFQNGHRTKGTIVASVGFLSLAGSVGSYLLLRSWCDPITAVCTADDGESREGEARIMRVVNLTSTAVLAGVALYGIIDGFAHYKRERRRVTVGWMPVSNGAGLTAVGRF